MNHPLLHPTLPDQRAEYGWDRALGFFVQLYCDGVSTRSTDRLRADHDHDRPLKGALDVLVEAGFTTWNDLNAARRMGAVMRIEAMPADVARAATIVNMDVSCNQMAWHEGSGEHVMSPVQRSLRFRVVAI